MTILSEDKLKQFSEFLDWFDAIHKLDSAYSKFDDGMNWHYRAGEALYNNSIGFLEKLPLMPGDKVIDIGMGYGFHCAWFSGKGADVTGITTHLTTDLQAHADEHGYKTACTDMHFPDFGECQFDLAWSHHSLEHTFSPLFALRQWYRLLKPGGYLAVTVPPHKLDIVSGHFNVGWNIGQLMYVLGCAGFELENAWFIEEGYNVRALVTRPLQDPDPDGLSWMFKLEQHLPDMIRQRMQDAPKSLGRRFYNGNLAEVGKGFFKEKD